MTFTRGKRIALELLGPPALGATLMIALMAGITVVETIEKGDVLQRLKELAQGTVFVAVFAYMLAGAQSILYACIMEWRFARGLDPRSWRSVVLRRVWLLARRSCWSSVGAAICTPSGFGCSMVASDCWSVFPSAF
jgi:hypothetical protein